VQAVQARRLGVLDFPQCLRRAGEGAGPAKIVRTDPASRRQGFGLEVQSFRASISIVWEKAFSI
jgi:hypothetical protein